MYAPEGQAPTKMHIIEEHTAKELLITQFDCDLCEVYQESKENSRVGAAE